MFRRLGRSSRNWLVLLGVVLTACATPSSLGREEHEPTEVVSSWQEARADPSCVVPLCDEERCALWRCQDVVEVEAPSVVQAFSTQGFPGASINGCTVEGPKGASGMRPGENSGGRTVEPPRRTCGGSRASS